MQKMKLFLFVGILSLFFIGQLPAVEPAENLTPVGFWRTIDDKTGEVKSIVKIWTAQDGTLKGRIEKIFPKEGEDPDPVCDKCKGDRKDQPVLGMEFLWGFKGAGSIWKNGEVLDPENGKIYSCQLEVIDNGEKLKVFGYIRIIFKIGRSQIWLREPVDQ
jgi:uncharacterized protein (DUF2147 family)